MIPAQSPPNDKRAEGALIGLALRDKAALLAMMDVLQSQEFHDFAHQRIWSVLTWLVLNGKEISLIIVADRLYELNCMKEVGGYEYLVDLWDKGPVQRDPYLKIVKDHAVRRSYLRVVERMAQNLLDGMSVEDMIPEAESMVFNLKSGGKSSLKTMPPAVNEAYEAMDWRKRNHGRDYELPFGWQSLDKMTSGLQRGELLIVGARPSVGKTMFAQNVMLNLARNNRKIFCASLEQSASSMAERMICQITKIDSWRMRSGRFEASDGDLVMDAGDFLKSCTITFDDASQQSAQHVVSQARRLALANPLDCVVVDYLSLIEPEDRRAQRYLQVGQICQRMKQLAKDLNVPVMLLSQLSRDSDGKRPGLADLRESGDIEQHADCVMLLHREHELDVKYDSQVIEVLIRKQRNGPIGDIKLLHHKKHYELVENIS